MQTFEGAFWVVIPASGFGARFNHSLPKQYWPLFDQTILEHCIDRFLEKKWITKVVVAIAATDHHFAQLPAAKHPKVLTVQGGQTRSHSVLNALHYLQRQAKPNDWVLVHDAVRPCLHEEDLKSLLQLREDPVGGILATPVTDTLKKVVDLQINETISRETLWAAQTPQMFRLNLLVDALCTAHDTGQVVTDESSAIEAMGYHPQIICAKHPNPKLTYAGDMSYIELLLAKQTEALTK
jgi:2-C-methyl-D-erythritol 4-phosphate cytidylyltransferase